MKTKALLTVAMMLAFAAAAFAGVTAGVVDDKVPDFSGKWKLDTAKSDFGMAPPTESQTNVIEQKENLMKIATTQKGAQGEASFESKYTLDGKESVNTRGTRETKTIAKWEGKKIVMTFNVDLQGTALKIKQSYSLGDDGKTMTIDVEFKSDAFEGTQKLIFNKE